MKKILSLLLVLSLLLGLFAGCGQEEISVWSPPTQVETTEPQIVLPPDGNPNDITCKGSYTGEVNSDQVVAKVGDRELTNGLLQAFYWAEAAAFRDAEVRPDYEKRLDAQPCPLDDTVASWQQYFLKRALNTWHSAQALVLRSEQETLTFEEAYQPNPKVHADNMTGKPATKFLYGYNDHYQLNTMHEAYLNSLPQVLEEVAQEKGYMSADAMAGEAFQTTAEQLLAFADLCNRAYMYLTFLGYDVNPTQEEVNAWCDRQGISREGGKTVDVRHILIEDHQEAEKLLRSWKRDHWATEGTFAELAVRNSRDAGTALDGGAYHHLMQGQLPAEMDAWCFDDSRKAGDAELFKAEDGSHILYFDGSTDLWFAQAQADLVAHLEGEEIAAARSRYPMEVDYAAIGLRLAEGTVEMGDLLYPDVAHERFPEVPLYLQQDYPQTMYGQFPIRSHGCGITTMSMLASYMTDSLLTPPIMCDRYGHYCHSNGTDGMIFIKEPREMGFYFRERVFEAKDALAALEAGYPVVCIQHKGYWTGSGHYLLLEELTEDGLVRVRDSNIANYGKLEGHKEDKFEWRFIPPAVYGFWVFEKKITAIPACTRCGEGQSELVEGYLCDKCERALARRETYLNFCGE